MPNSILYNVNSQSLSLKKGNFWIGTGDVGKGPSSSTGYFDGVTPGSNQYVIYYNKSGSNRIYYCASGDQVYTITNRLKGQNFTTLESALSYIATQSDMLCTNINYEPIVTDGLVLNVDAGFTASYPKTNTTWYDISNKGNNTILYNGPIFNSSNGGSIFCDGVDDNIQVTTNETLSPTSNFTVESWFKFLNLNGVGICPIFEKYLWNNGVGKGGWNLRIGNYGGDSKLWWGGGSNDLWTSIPTNTQCTSGNWYHCVGVCDGGPSSNSGYWKVYLNGVLENSAPIGYDVGTQLTMNIFFGERGDDSGANSTGYWAINRMYNRVLSSKEILQNYNAQKGRFGL